MLGAQSMPLLLIFGVHACILLRGDNTSSLSSQVTIIESKLQEVL
jgi:hypothetical protein